MTLGHLRLLLHTQHFHLCIQFHHTSTLQFLDRRLLMTHDTRGAFFLCEVNKLLKAEEQQVICCHYQHVIIDMQFIHGVQQITYGTQSGVICLSPVIHDGDGLLPSAFFLLPFFKYRCKPMI